MENGKKLEKTENSQDRNLKKNSKTGEKLENSKKTKTGTTRNLNKFENWLKKTRKLKKKTRKTRNIKNSKTRKKSKAQKTSKTEKKFKAPIIKKLENSIKKVENQKNISDPAELMQTILDEVYAGQRIKRESSLTSILQFYSTPSIGFDSVARLNYG